MLVLRLDASGEIADDEFFVHYIVIQNPHGSGGTAKGKIISFRVVCQNTFASACSAASDFAITHRVASGSAEEQAEVMAKRTQDAIKAWDKVQEHIRVLSEKVNTWSAAPIARADAEHLTEALLDIPAGKGTEATGRKRNMREAILDAWNRPQYGTFGQTGYDWLNAVTFVNSSPFSEIVQKSKVGAVDRAVRNMSATGTGFKVEQKAERILEGFIS